MGTSSATGGRHDIDYDYNYLVLYLYSCVLHYFRRRDGELGVLTDPLRPAAHSTRSASLRMRDILNIVAVENGDIVLRGLESEITELQEALNVLDGAEAE